jgi:5-oxoprolinase (ATP-hydrolysing) subunit A
MNIDLNADLGEDAGFDRELMPLITSANICCGVHAGGPAAIRAAFELAKSHGVAIGAHPGYADRESFGRRESTLTASAIVDLVDYQLAAFDALARRADVKWKYVKAHGALYNQACRDAEVAAALVDAVQPWGVPLVGLPNSALETAAANRGVPFFAEGFADRRYRPDGSLVPRSDPDAFIHDPLEAVAQVGTLVKRGIRTVCVHGDNPQAVAFATAVRLALQDAGYELTPFT